MDRPHDLFPLLKVRSFGLYKRGLVKQIKASIDAKQRYSYLRQGRYVYD